MDSDNRMDRSCRLSAVWVHLFHTLQHHRQLQRDGWREGGREARGGTVDGLFLCIVQYIPASRRLSLS